MVELKLPEKLFLGIRSISVPQQALRQPMV
jgi:hypothetical protein